MNKVKRTIPTKHQLALIDLLHAGTTGISKLTELASYGETALTTTISELGLVRGLVIHRELRPHTHRHGGKTFFTWYWLADQHQAAKAIELIQLLSPTPCYEILSNSHALIAAFPTGNRGSCAND